MIFFIWWDSHWRKKEVMNKGSEKRKSWKRKHLDKTAKERVSRKVLKKSKNNEKDTKKKVADESVSVSKSSAHKGRYRWLELPVPILVSEEVGVLSTLATTGVTIADFEASQPSYDFPDSHT